MRRVFLNLLLALQLMPAQAQTPVGLYESFAGNVNFAGTQRTIRRESNAGDACAVYGSNTDVDATLAGIPSGATILRAHLYWAGSGPADYNVQIDRINVSAASDRRYTATANGRNYFGGAADVTSRVAGKGNGIYRFRRLTVEDGGGFCSVEGVTGGFALLVVYSHPGEPFRVLNVYEGFQPTHYSRVDLTLSNFKIPNPIGAATGRIGHITWEGDSTLGNTNAENLFFNGYEMTDGSNPQYNQFNSSSNINNDPFSWGIDFDAYTVTSPVIQPGQTIATTRYQSGQDLVLLHSEVIAVPNVPVSDLSITKTVASPVMTQGTTNSYQITVANNGPMAESGPIVVSDTIAPELTIASASGAGWSCTISGQQVTCTWTGSVAAGLTLAPITIMVSPPGSPPAIDNTATVAGQNFDNNLENNSATVSTSGAAADYVLTDAPCLHNVPFSSPSQTCNIYIFGTRTAGEEVGSIYITALNGIGVPRRLSWSRAQDVDFYFGFSCLNPTTTAGVAPAFSARVAMPTCAAAGAKPVGAFSSTVTFPTGSPSSAVGYTFSYNDVGMVELYFEDRSGKTGSTGAFVVKPASIALSGIRQTGTNLPNPEAAEPSGARFIPAGALFSMTVSALASNGNPTPNFGREIEPETFSIAVGGAIDPLTGQVFTDLQNIPPVSGPWGPIVAGASSGSGFAWPEVGIVRLVPGVASGSYLGKGPVPALPRNVGRFYPDHFDTAVEAPLAAPSGVGAAYSRQPFAVEVTARNAANGVTANYRGSFARQVTLTAWSGTGSGSSQNPPGGATLSNGVVSNFNAGVGESTPDYGFPVPYSSDQAGMQLWTPPTTIFLRADETAPAGDGVTSRRAIGTEEGAVRIVAGRLQVSNAYGSDLLNLPVPVRAQYWTGTRWVNSIKDEVSQVLPVGANLQFSSCSGTLPANCTFAPLSTAAFTLDGGLGTLRLLPPAAGQSGGVRLKVNGTPWLPSTIGQLVFGKRKAKLDYIREVY